MEKLRSILRNGPYDAGPYGGNAAALIRALLGLPPVSPGRSPKKWAGRIAMNDDDAIVIFEISALEFPSAASSLLREFGRPAVFTNGLPNALVFRETVNNRANDRGFRLTVDEGVRLKFNRRDFTGIRPLWTRDQIARMSCVTAGDCVLHFESEDGKSATVCRGLRPSLLFEGLRDGKVFADFELCANRHAEVFGWAAFRARASDFPSLYESAKRVAAGRIPAAVRPTGRLLHA